jgi:hypothetical protein
MPDLADSPLLVIERMLRTTYFALSIGRWRRLCVLMEAIVGRNHSPGTRRILWYAQ